MNVSRDAVRATLDYLHRDSSVVFLVLLGKPCLLGGQAITRVMVALHREPCWFLSP